MAAALSLDLRRRVIAAIEAGASCRQAAARFGIATPIRRQAQWRQEGHVAAKPMGGDRSSHRIEAHAALILTMLDARPQLFLRELRDQLREHGVETGTSGLWRSRSVQSISSIAMPLARLSTNALPTSTMQVRVMPTSLTSRRDLFQSLARCRAPTVLPSVGTSSFRRSGADIDEARGVGGDGTPPATR